MTEQERIEFIKGVQAGPKGTCYKALKKAAADFTTGDNGTISGYFSIFAKPMPGGRYEGKTDSYGDICDPHCFDETIRRRKASGKPWPLLYNHSWDQIIGRVIDIKTDSYGAWMQAEFFPTERAAEIRAICAASVLFNFSFAYETIKSEKVILTDGTRANCLKEVELFEVTITGIPAETRTHVTDIKQSESAIASRRRNALAYIADLERQKAEKKRELLAIIDKMAAKDAGVQIEKYKKLEEKALADIARATETGNTAWKVQRQRALKAIRAEITRLEA